jgi:DNA-directed RNA polymerase specialized sigma24 family protein
MGWQKYLKKMRGVLSRRGRERDEIDDLMQDAVVRLLEFTEQAVENLGLLDFGPGPEEVLAGEQCLEEMRKTLDAVNRRTREVFFMHRLHGLRYAQIAERMNMPVSTVEKHIARAMTVLLEKQRREMQRHD